MALIRNLLEKVKRGRKSFFRTDSNTEAKQSPELLNYGYSLLLANMLFGLLPIQLFKNSVKHSNLSISTLYSWVMTLAMIWTSIVFLQVRNEVFFKYYGKSGTVCDVAINIGNTCYIFGFIFLTLRAKMMAKHFPGIWSKASETFKIGQAQSETGSRGLQPLQNFCRNCFISYILTLGANEFATYAQDEDKLREAFEDIFNISLSTQTRKLVFNAGYLLWDTTILSHVLVSVLVIFLVLSLHISLVSVNEQFCSLLSTIGTKTGGDIPIAVEGSTGEGQVDEKLVEEKLANYLRCYCLVESVVMDLSQVFGFSLFIEILILVGTSIANIYFAIVNYTQTKEIMAIVDPAITLFANAHFIFWLAVIATKLTNESRRPIQILRNSGYLQFPANIQIKLQQFQSDISLTVVSLTAADYFVLNKACIASISSFVLTFVIVLIQFKSDEMTAELKAS